MPIMSRVHQPVRADVLLLIVTLLAGSGWIFSKEALAGLAPLQFVGLRFLLAGLVVAAVGWRPLRMLEWRALAQAVGVGVLFAVAMAFWILGLEYGPHVGEGAFISSLGIILVPVLARWIFQDQPPLSTWLALPLAVLGFACLSLRQGLHFELGQWLYLAAAVTFAFLFNFNSRVVLRVPALALTAVQLLVVGALGLAASALVEDWPQAVSVEVWGWFLASVLIASSLRFFLQVFAQGLTSASHAAVIMMLEPVWAALLAAAWFGETMQGIQLLGCALIFLALIINRWRWVRRMIRC